MPDQTYRVAGMTCGHCVTAVTGEISQIDGVAAVDVDLESGRVLVSGADFTDDDVRAAVDEAGYELVS